MIAWICVAVSLVFVAYTWTRSVWVTYEVKSAVTRAVLGTERYQLRSEARTWARRLVSTVALVLSVGWALGVLP